MIEQLGFPGYFLVVYDIVDVLPGQRASSARAGARRPTRRSATRCGITNVDAVKYGLLFERFLAPERDGPPDIDVDIESDRREEVIQHVYEQVRPATTPPRSPTSSPTGRGRRCGTWPRRSATRPASRTPGASRSTAGGRWPTPSTDDIPSEVVELRQRAADLPAAPGHPLRRHGDLRPAGDRGVPGGVGPDGEPHGAAVGQGRLRRRRAGQVRPARAGHALGAALRGRLRRRHELDIWPRCRWTTTRSTTCSAGPTRSACSRWRAGPRWPPCPGCSPRKFYDLVVEVALIRPGPIQGGSVHPYIRRKQGQEPADLAAPAAGERRWSARSGVPLFQEQLMQMAIDVAGFDAGRGRPAAPGDGLQAVGRADGAAAASGLYDGHGRATASPASWPTTSTSSSPRSPTTASRRATR